MPPRQVSSRIIILGLCGLCIWIMALACFRINAFTAVSLRMLAPMTASMPIFRKFSGWTRVGVSSEDDAKRLYPLIMELVHNPQKAQSIKEVFFLYPRQVGPEYDGLNLFRRLQNAEPSFGIAPDPLLVQTIEKLSLGVTYRTREKLLLKSNNTADWIRAITWMNPDFWQLRHDVLPDDDEFRWFVMNESYTFVQYAIVLLLALCPNVELLQWQDGNRNDLMEQILWHNNYGKLPHPFLQNLKRVEYLPNPDWTAVSTGEMDDIDLFSDVDHGFYIYMSLSSMAMAVHRLPSMESISISGVDGGDRGNSSAMFLMPPGTSTIRKISITHSMYPSMFLGQLIRTPKVLEEFTCTSGGRALRGDANYRRPKTIGKALLCHKETLRILDLDMNEYLIHSGEGGSEEDGVNVAWLKGSQLQHRLGIDEWFRLDWEISSGPLMAADIPDTREYSNTIGSLHDFGKLTRLSINVRLLLGWRYSPELPYFVPFRLVDALPPNLEYLLIRGYRRGIEPVWDDHIDEFIALRSEQYPFLKEVHGIEDHVPNGKSFDYLRNPDFDRDQTWKREPVNTTWS